MKVKLHENFNYSERNVFSGMLLLTLEKPRRRVVQPQTIPRQNKQRNKEHNELTISAYRNIRKILKRQRISIFFAAI